MKRSIIMCIASFIGAALPAQTITTLPSWGGAWYEAVEAFGSPNTSTYGQTFFAPTSVYRLQTFSYYLKNDDLYVTGMPGSNLEFRAYVMEWDEANQHAVGPVVWQSSVFNGTAVNDFVRFDFNTGGLDLGAGIQYVAFLNTSEYINSHPGNGPTQIFGLNVDPDSYSGGSYVYANFGGDFGALTTTEWDSSFLPSFGDAAFEMQFAPSITATPEPTTGWLLGTGLIAIVGAVRRRSARRR